MDTQVLWFASRATGAVSLVLFTAVMVLGIITSGRLGMPGLPRAGVLRLHRNLTLVSMAFLAVHIVAAIADGYVDLSYWDVLIPFGAGFDPFWIGLATVASTCPPMPCGRWRCCTASASPAATAGRPGC